MKSMSVYASDSVFLAGGVVSSLIDSSGFWAVIGAVIAGVFSWKTQESTLKKANAFNAEENEKDRRETEKGRKEQLNSDFFRSQRRAIGEYIDSVVNATKEYLKYSNSDEIYDRAVNNLSLMAEKVSDELSRKELFKLELTILQFHAFLNYVTDIARFEVRLSLEVGDKQIRKLAFKIRCDVLEQINQLNDHIEKVKSGKCAIDSDMVHELLHYDPSANLMDVAYLAHRIFSENYKSLGEPD